MAKILALFKRSRTTSHSWKRFQYNKVKKFVRSLQWFHIPISLVLAFIAFQQFRRIKRREISKIEEQNNAIKPIYIARDIEISMYKMLPLRTLSRMWGWINSIELPVIMRSPILKSYVRAFGCNLDEADIHDLKQYKNLGEFFRRSLKPGVRPIDSSNGVVSPSDGTILYLGKANEGKVEQVKGITYSLKSFLGPQTWRLVKQQNGDNYENEMIDYQNTLLANKDSICTELYHCIIYLAPGDYHRFHSPAQWKINYRRHFPGKLLSVRPTFASWFPSLFNVNERVIYIGQWNYGFFSMAAVGATNVGSVKVYFDDNLVTNEKRWTSGTFNDLKLNNQISFNKGDAFGEFNLGSTIVLIFEGPKNMSFDVKAGQKIKYGQLISKVDEPINEANIATEGA